MEGEFHTFYVNHQLSKAYLCESGTR